MSTNWFGTILTNILNKAGVQSHPGAWGTPDIGLTELLQGSNAPRNMQGGSTLRNVTTQEYLPSNFRTAEQIKAASGGQVLGSTTTGGGGGGGNLDLGSPTTTPVDASNADASLAAWQAARQRILDQGPLLDQSFVQGKTDIQDSIDSANRSAATQTDINNSAYGDLLRGNLQTYQDTNRSRQGIFSNLGTLDSSAFQEQQFRGDQTFGQNKSSIEQDQVRTNTGIQNTLTDFTNKAKSGLAYLAIQYQAGKNALSSALAQGDIAGAQDVSAALADIRQKAADINNVIITFQNQANLYKTLGYNVTTTVPTYNATGITPGLTNSFGDQLKNIQNMTPSATTGIQGQGYILDAQGNKRDPLTGQIIA